jgi:peptidyl-prolyl cis-trans isomerase SurA
MTNDKIGIVGCKMYRLIALYLNSLLLVIIFVISAFAQSETIDRIVARVNREIITLSDLREAGQQYLAAAESQLTGPDKEMKVEELEKEILGKMIEEKLIIYKAKAIGITVKEKEIDKAIDEVKQRHSLNDFQFQNLLEQQGTSLEDYKERIKNQILIARALNFEVHSKINLTEAEAKEYYEKHKGEFVLPGDIKIRQILIQCPPNADNAERQRAETEAEYIHRALLDGADFAQLAKKHSQDPLADKGGDIGYTKKGELLPSLEKVLFELEEKAISSVINTERGFHIMKVEEKRENRLKPFSEVRDTIMDKLYKDKIDTRHRQWIDEIKKDAFVESLY